jgi:hypothetical protein
MASAIARDGEGQSALLAGDADGARAGFTAAADLYRRSWEAAPPKSYGRLVGMLKSAILAGGHPEGQAEYVRAALGYEGDQSPTAAYAQAVAALLVDDDEAAARWASAMRSGSDAFVRTADAITALATRDQPSYAAALASIVRDFESRSEHLTGVAIADTALMLELLAARRGITAGVHSELLPA